jgi:hypothetical protein
MKTEVKTAIELRKQLRCMDVSLLNEQFQIDEA